LSARVFLVAAEASGDALGADLIGALKSRDASLVFTGVGGEQMAEAGVTSAIDIKHLGVLGFVDGLMAYGRVVRAADRTVEAALAFKPDVVVLIDSWGFTLRVAQRLRAAAPRIPIVKYIGPQVWATRPGRAQTLARTVDHLICIHDFEVPYYTPFGLACTVCGHPAFGRFAPGDGAAFRARHRIGANEKLLLVLPGSRRAEIRRIGPTLWRAANLLKEKHPELRFVMVAARAVESAARSGAPADALIVGEAEKENAFAAADTALAASGTVTTEVALQGAPLVIGYKLGWITWALARGFLFKGRFVTLMNVAADAEAAPEFIQTRFTPENLAAAAAPLLDDVSLREEQVRRQDEALARMGRGGRPAADIAAEAVLDVMRKASQSAR
jgi:lipid-A-disaccharide synthase